MAGSIEERRLAALVARVMPEGAVPVEIADGPARVRVGAGEPRVRILVRDRGALKRLLLRRAPLVAFALAYADGALDVEGDILEVARLKRNFPAHRLSLGERLAVALALLRW
jgi:hypothetical protein